MTLLAVLIAMAIIMKSFLSIETTNFRATFFDIPLLVIGIIFGPILGAISGFIVDFYHIIFSPNAMSFNWFTVGTMVWAVVPGILLFRRKFTKSKVIFTIIIASVLSFVFNTMGIESLFGMGAVLSSIYVRLAVMLIKLPIQVLFIEIIYYRVIITQLKLTK